MQTAQRYEAGPINTAAVHFILAWARRSGKHSYGMHFYTVSHKTGPATYATNSNLNPF